MSSRIENYLGFPAGLSGNELTHRAVTQAKRFGVEILTPQRVVNLIAGNSTKKVMLQDGTELQGKAILIATGVSYRKLQAKCIEKFNGSGIYYGASMSEGPSVKGKNILIVGGANSAGQAAMYFSRFAEKVTMIIRDVSISKSMSQYLIDQIDATPNIKIEAHTEIIETMGSKKLDAVKLLNKKDNKETDLAVSAVFIFIGAYPHTDWLGEQVARDEHGFILSGWEIDDTNRARFYPAIKRAPLMLETSVPGVFVAGDVRHGSVKRVASAGTSVNFLS